MKNLPWRTLIDLETYQDSRLLQVMGSARHPSVPSATCKLSVDIDRYFQCGLRSIIIELCLHPNLGVTNHVGIKKNKNIVY